MNLSSMIKGALLALIFLALLVGFLPPDAQRGRMGGSGWFPIGQNAERTGSSYVASAY